MARQSAEEGQAAVTAARVELPPTKPYVQCNNISPVPVHRMDATPEFGSGGGGLPGQEQRLRVDATPVFGGREDGGQRRWRAEHPAGAASRVLLGVKEEAAPAAAAAATPAVTRMDTSPVFGFGDDLQTRRAATASAAAATSAAAVNPAASGESRGATKVVVLEPGVLCVTRPLKANERHHCMTVLRLEDGSLFVHSPLRLDAVCRQALDELGGDVKHIVLPCTNTGGYHDQALCPTTVLGPVVRLQASRLVLAAHLVPWVGVNSFQGTRK